MTPLDAANRFPGLTRVPAAVVARLAQSAGRIVSRDDLLTAIEDGRGIEASTDDALRSAVKVARRAIADQGRIETAYGFGYRLVWL